MSQKINTIIDFFCYKDYAMVTVPFMKKTAEMENFLYYGYRLELLSPTLGRVEDLFKLQQPPSTGLLLICMIKKHTSIFRALQGNQGVAATPPSPKRGK